MYEVMQKARKKGLTELEKDVEEPDKSELFKTWDHELRDFVCDTLRMAMTGGPTPFDLDQLMELDMEVHHHYSHLPSQALTTVADSLPGLGIVAAVLGVVITMGALGGPPEEIGHKVAAALVGTFLGILLCYGLLGPMADKMGKAAEEEGHFLHVVRVALIAFLKGNSPQLAVEFGRRAVPGTPGPVSSSWRRSAGERRAKFHGRSGFRIVGCSADHRQEESRPWRPSRWRLESGLRRFRHRNDGSVHRAVADEFE